MDEFMRATQALKVAFSAINEIQARDDAEQKELAQAQGDINQCYMKLLEIEKARR